MPRHKKKKRAAAATAASVKKTDWLVGDLVVAKLRGHRPWPAQIQKPEDYGYDPRPHRIFVTFFGTEETCFCSYNKITPFTTVVRKNLAEQLQKINTNPELERAIKEIFAADDEMKVSSKGHGSSQKEDEEMVSEKSEDEEPPVEPRSRKRGRVVEETVAAPVPVADERPAKMEKTVKNMAAEQVQKLPRKVRIKVSTQGSDLGSIQQQGGDRAAGVSSSQARHSQPVDSAKMPVKNNGDRATSGKVDDSIVENSSVSLKEGGESIIVEVEETVRHDASENGGDTNKDLSAKEPAAKANTESDAVEKMEVEDEKSLVSETTSEPPICKEDAEKPVVSKTSEHAIEKGDAETPVVLKTSELAIEKEDAETPVVAKISAPAVEKEDAEKPVVPKTSEPATEKEDPYSTINEPGKSKIAEDGVEEMEVDEKFVASKTGGPSIDKEDDSSAANEAVTTSETGVDALEKMEVDIQNSTTGTRPAAVEEESSKGDGSTRKEESTIVSTNEQHVNQISEAKAEEDIHTVEDMDTSRAGQVEGVPPAAKEVVGDASKSDSQSVDSERADDGLQIKLSTASTKQDAIGEGPPKDPAPVVSASTKDEEKKEQKDGVVKAQQVATKDDAVSRTDVMVVSRSNLQAGAVDQAGEDRVGAVKKTEEQNGTVKKVVNQDEDVKMTEDRDGAVKKVEDHDGGVKKTEDPGSEAKKAEEHAAELKKTEEQDATVELRKIEKQDARAKKTEDQDIEAKKTEEHAAELKKTEEQDATAELKKIEEQDVGVKTKEDKEVAVRESDSKGGVVNVTEMSTEAKGDAEKTVTSTTPEAKPEVATPRIDSGGKAEVPTPGAKQEDTATISSTGNGEVPSTGKQEGDRPQFVEISTPAAKRDAGESKEQPAEAS